MNKLSVTFFLHPSRKENINIILDNYSKYEIIDEILIVTGSEVQILNQSDKCKIIQIPGPYAYGKWPHTGLIGRYIFALICRNRYVFIQDDDCYYNETTFIKLLNIQSPLSGTKSTPRWFYNNRYQAKKEVDVDKAEILITRGILVDSTLLPEVIQYAKLFWKNDFQSVFNGEDIFLSRAVSKITGIKEFPYLKDDFVELPTYNVQLDKVINKKGSRTVISQKIYDFFEKEKNV